MLIGTIGSGVNVMGLMNCFLIVFKAISIEGKSGVLLYNQPTSHAWENYRS